VFDSFKLGLNMWVLKDIENLFDHERPKVTNDLNFILEHAIFTNKCLIEMKKKQLSKDEYARFMKKINAKEKSK